MTREELYQRYGEGILIAAAMTADRKTSVAYGDSRVLEIGVEDIDRAERAAQIVAERAGMGTMEPRRG